MYNYVTVKSRYYQFYGKKLRDSIVYRSVLLFSKIKINVIVVKSQMLSFFYIRYVNTSSFSC